MDSESAYGVNECKTSHGLLMKAIDSIMLNRFKKNYTCTASGIPISIYFHVSTYLVLSKMQI